MQCRRIVFKNKKITIKKKLKWRVIDINYPKKQK